MKKTKQNKTKQKTATIPDIKVTFSYSCSQTFRNPSSVEVPLPVILKSQKKNGHWGGGMSLLVNGWKLQIKPMTFGIINIVKKIGDVINCYDLCSPGY